MRTVNGTAQSMTTPSCSARMTTGAMEHQVEGERRPLARQLRVDVQRWRPGRSPQNPYASACQSPPIVAR